jgi:acetyltransferase-like isoleucine patch superfamily enzyme
MLYWEVWKHIFEPLRLAYFGIKWRKANRHNRTFAGNRFDINKVCIGKETYGYINVLSNNDANAGNLKIGNYCSIARTALFLTSGNHNYHTLSTYPFKQLFFKKNNCGSKGDIIIEDDVWIGENVTVLSGSHIGQGAVIAANALVSGQIAPYAIVGGVPAKLIKFRFSSDVIQKLNEVNYEKIDFILSK